MTSGTLYVGVYLQLQTETVSLSTGNVHYVWMLCPGWGEMPPKYLRGRQKRLKVKSGTTNKLIRKSWTWQNNKKQKCWQNNKQRLPGIRMTLFQDWISAVWEDMNGLLPLQQLSLSGITTKTVNANGPLQNEWGDVLHRNVRPSNCHIGQWERAH